MAGPAWIRVALAVCLQSAAVHAQPAPGVATDLSAAANGAVDPSTANDAVDPSTIPATLVLRLFLDDGTSLVSHGEFTGVGDRVVFAMPTSADADDPHLHLVSVPSARVDWDRTNRYAHAARAARYVATRAEDQYAMLSAEIGQALNDVALTTDPAARLAVVERARNTLAAWPAAHFGYKQAEIRRMLEILDETIADLRAAAGVHEFELSFVASPVRAAREPLLGRPTPREAIEQTLAAAALAGSPAERVSLMTAALAAIERDPEKLPGAWRTETRAAVRAAIDAEIETDRRYRLFAARTAGQASRHAKAADVRGLERLLVRIQDEDAALGYRRPDAVHALVVSVEQQLESARALSLARDRWALRAPELRKYRAALAQPVERLTGLAPMLERIRSMAETSPAMLSSVERTAAQALEIVAPLLAPPEFGAAHALLVSGAQLAASAARIRREAALAGDMTRAWDASSAAAGALMLVSRARAEMDRALAPPGLQ